MEQLIINIGIPVATIFLAMVTGTILETRHFKLIKRREAALGHIALLTGKEYPTDTAVAEAHLVSGGVVVSVDYFKRFLDTAVKPLPLPRVFRLHDFFL